MRNLFKKIFGRIGYSLSPTVREKTDSVVKSHEKLIQEYYRIREKKSLLSASQREEVIVKVHALIAAGHIKSDDSKQVKEIVQEPVLKKV